MKKLAQKGASQLTNAELLAIIIGSGSTKRTALDLAKYLLGTVDQDLDKLGRSTITQLKKTKGIGNAKAISILAALELGRRKQFASNEAPVQIQSSEDAYHWLLQELSNLQHEEFWVILLNAGHKVIRKIQVSSGGINKTVVDPRILFREAITEGAASIILAHNHPSGRLQPSQADINLTKKLYEAGKLVDILVLDHLIISKSGYMSFSDSGLMIVD